MDNRRAGDAERADIAARKTGSDWRTDIALPNHRARNGVERVDIIRFCHHNNPRPAARATFDVKRLRVNIA